MGPNPNMQNINNQVSKALGLKDNYTGDFMDRNTGSGLQFDNYSGQSQTEVKEMKFTLKNTTTKKLIFGLSLGNFRDIVRVGMPATGSVVMVGGGTVSTTETIPLVFFDNPTKLGKALGITLHALLGDGLEDGVNDGIVYKDAVGELKVTKEADFRFDMLDSFVKANSALIDFIQLDGINQESIRANTIRLFRMTPFGRPTQKYISANSYLDLTTTQNTIRMGFADKKEAVIIDPMTIFVFDIPDKALGGPSEYTVTIGVREIASLPAVADKALRATL